MNPIIVCLAILFIIIIVLCCYSKEQFQLFPGTILGQSPCSLEKTPLDCGLKPSCEWNYKSKSCQPLPSIYE
jgi:hypothetical protein